VCVCVCVCVCSLADAANVRRLVLCSVQQRESVNVKKFISKK
jgi:hypothetical protein